LFSESAFTYLKLYIVLNCCDSNVLNIGSCSSDESTKSWPAQLFDMLGQDESQYEVYNYGVSGRTMMKTGDNPYWNEEAYQLALSSDADVIFLMLGTNDAKTYQWNQTEYINDYIEMGTSFLVMESTPELVVMVKLSYICVYFKNDVCYVF
jgi:lysophospholipase L1-like esterase